jgi:hypothetical protein
VDQLVFDELPDDTGHFIAVEFDDRVGDFDFAHVLPRQGFWEGAAIRLGLVAP